MSIGSFTKQQFKNLFSKPVTTKYPFEARIFPERTRGHIENNIDVCVLCGLCSMKCPSHAITVDKAAHTWSINPFGCIQCGYCVESCPKKCLTMKNTYQTPEAHKESVTLSYTQERIDAEEAARKAAIEKAMAAKKAAEEKAMAANKAAEEKPMAANKAAEENS